MILLGVCAGLPAFSIDLSAPTLTILPSALGTNITVAGLTLTLFMLGFAFGLVTGGRLSDQRGRRPTLLIALLLYSFAGLCCALATSGPLLVIARCLQGIGAGACAVQAPAIVQDVFEGEEARRKQAYVTLVLAVVPLLAPAIGSGFVYRWGWRSVHVVLAIGGTVLCAVIATSFAETRQRAHGFVARGLGFEDAAQMLANIAFRRVVIANALSYGAIFAYISGSPAVVMGQLGLSSAAFAIHFALTALGLTAGTATNVVLGRNGIDSIQTVRPALLLQTAATLALLVGSLDVAQFAYPLIVPALVLFCFARGLVSPNMTFLAISAFRPQPGLASALLGLLQLLAGAAASAVVATLMPYLGYVGVACTMAACAIAALIVWSVRAGEVRPAGT